MKKGWIFLVILFTGVQFTAAQQSDYEVSQNFIEQYEWFKQQVVFSERSSQLERLSKQVDSLFADFAPFELLINQAFFPATYTSMKKELSSSVIQNKQQLIVIENQRERLMELGNQVAAYRSEIDYLNDVARKLRNEIAVSMESEQRLSQMLRAYRQQMEQRDALIFEMIDSLVITHRGLTNAEGATGGEMETQVLTNQNNPLHLTFLCL